MCSICLLSAWYHVNINHKEAGLASLIQNKEQLKVRNITRQKGTYTVSEDKDELILKEEYGYYPYAHKNPNPEWEADDNIWEADIELQENNQVLRLNARGWLIPLKLQKVK